MIKKDKRKVAIIKTHSIGGYDDEYQIIDRITDWAEVSNEDFKILQTYCWGNDLTLIEQFTNDFPLMLQEHLEKAKKAEEEKLRKQKEKEEKAKQKQAEATKKQAAKEKKLLEELKKKYEK